MRTTLPVLAALLCISLPTQAAPDEAPHCRYVQVVDLPLRYAGVGLAPAVDATINDTPAVMLVDTGAYNTVLTMTAVARRGLTLHWTGDRATGVGGESRVYTAHVKEVGVGPVRRTRTTEMTVIGDTTSTPTFDGLLGAPFLLQMDLMVDLRARRMTLYQPRDCDKTDLLLWKEDTFVVPIFGHTPENPNPHFNVIVNGRKLEAEIDTGAHRSFMTLEAAKRVGIDVKGTKAERHGFAGGVGDQRAPHWFASVKTVEIGGETVRDAELGVIDALGELSTDIYLGQDFLRAHRVLFAMRQSKLYLAYLGGDVFTRGTGIEPWMRQAAQAGDADAQYALAVAYADDDGERGDPAEHRAWMDKAAASGQPNARLAVARRQMLAGQPGAAVPALRAALDALPADRYGPLWLYLARIQNGEAELGRRELAAAVELQQMDDWPYPIAQFYLGKWDANRLLAEAGKNKALAQERTRQAEAYLDEWRAARGDAPPR